MAFHCYANAVMIAQDAIIALCQAIDLVWYSILLREVHVAIPHALAVEGCQNMIF